MAHRRKAPNEWDIYCRLSRAIDGSLENVERQEAECRARAQGDKNAIGRVHTDNNLSAWRRDRKRPGWDRVLQRIRDGEIAGLYAYHDDRLIRHPADLEQLLEAADQCEDFHGFGVQLKLSDTTYDLRKDEVKTHLRQRAIYAWQEVANTSRRVKAKLRYKRQQGQMPWFREAFGYEVGTGRPKPEQAKVVREIAARVLDEQHTWTEISDDLNERGVLTAAGNEWNRSRLRQMMAIKRHGGIIEWRDDDDELHVQLAARPEGTPEGEPWPVLDQVTFDRLQAFLAGAKRGRMRTTRTLLSGIAVCDQCDVGLLGANNTGHKSRMPDGSPRQTYRCAKDRGGCSMAITAVHLDTMVRQAVVEWYAQRAPELQQASYVIDAELDESTRHLTQLEKNYADMYAKLTAKGLDSEIIDTACAQVEQAVLRQRAKVLELKKADRASARIAVNAAERWDDTRTTVAERREMVQVAIKSIRVKRASPRGGFGRFDTSRVEIEFR
jgi:site-specific DNA recombinase